MADPNGYAKEHTVVWVAAGNSRPTLSQSLHHRNGDKTDNRVENLELVDEAAHAREHAESSRVRHTNGTFGGSR